MWELSDFEEVRLTSAQFNKWLELETIRNNALWRIAESVTHLQDHLQEAMEIATADNGKWQSLIRDEFKAGFVSVVEALTSTTLPPQPEQEGQLMARYKFNEDQEPVSFTLVFRGGQSKKGTAVGAGDVDLSVESSSAQLMAEIGPQTLSDDGSEVSAPITLTGQQMPVAELAVVTYKATNRDTGNQVAADVDEFETGAGEVAIGTLDSPVPLEEIPPTA